MNPLFQFETNRPGELEMLAGFLKEEYPAGEIADAYFLKWEYADNPFGKAIVTLAKDELQSVVAQYAVIPIQVIVGGNLLDASLSLNTLTAERYRGMGLFKKSAEANYKYCSDAGILFTIGVPNKNSFPGFKNKLDYAHPGNLNFLIKPIRPFQILKSFMWKSGEKKGNEIRIKINKETLAQKSISFLNPDVDCEMYNAFWKECKKEKGVALNRTLEYISWRYFKNPLRRYEVFKIVNNGEMKALIAIRTMNVFGMRACVVLDLLSTDELRAVELLNFVADVANENDLDIVMAATSNNKANYSRLRKSGFWKVPEFILPQQLPFIIRLHKEFEGSELLFNLDNWHFGFGDYDIF